MLVHVCATRPWLDISNWHQIWCDSQPCMLIMSRDLKHYAAEASNFVTRFEYLPHLKVSLERSQSLSI